MSLFRPEALRHRQGEWLGTLQLSQPLALWGLTAGVLASVLAVALFLVWGEGSRRVHLSGMLMPSQGLVRLVPPQPARVARLLVQEGQAVKAGEVLAWLGVDDPRLGGASQQALVASYQARLDSLEASRAQVLQLAQSRGESLQRRLASARQEEDALGRQAAFQAQRLALAEQALARFDALAGQQFISPAQLQARQEEVMAQRADTAALARQRAALSRELADLEAQVQALPLSTRQELEALARQRDELQEAQTRAAPQAADRELPLRAPADGVVAALYAAPGQAVSDESAVASLWPAGAALQGQLYAPSSALGFLRPGQPVRLRLQAFPYQKYGWLEGRVARVAQAPALASELALLPLPRAAAAAEPLYRVLVELPRQTMPVAGEVRALQPGMQLEADVLLERRRLIEWVLEPLQGWRQRG